MKPRRPLLLLLACAAIVGALAMLPGPSGAVEPVAVAVADFDYVDTSGEVLDQERAHAARLRELAQQVREGLDHSGRYRVVTLACEPHPCSAGRTDPAELLAKAQAAGARLLVYGGIQKMSTLVQYGNAQVVDIAADRLVFNRNISFRGDNDEAWRRAAQFLVADLVNETLVKR
jgi:Protein of unknown function (DUF2380)